MPQILTTMPSPVDKNCKHLMGLSVENKQMRRRS